MTNADKIRSLTDKELANFICGNANCQTCQFLTFGGCTLDEWLGKEHEEDDDD